jgi:nitrite reductase/ring-hydroxylating ferredoxin subunit
MEWKDVAAVEEIPDGGMKRVEVVGREIALARVGESIYAFGDRCPHMNAPLHEGKIENGRVICPLHKTEFDLSTGKRLSDPKIPIPKVLKAGAMMAGIRTHDLETYEARQENSRVLINLERRKPQGK